MRLATARDGGRDGRLLVVRRDGEAAADASGIAPSLQHALDHWDACEPALSALSRALDSPLPRAYEWVDGSAFLSHVRRVRRARGAEPPPTLETDPLVYQGGSGVLLGPREDIPLPDPQWGLDFEGAVCAGPGRRPRAGTCASCAWRTTSRSGPSCPPSSRRASGSSSRSPPPPSRPSS